MQGTEHPGPTEQHEVGSAAQRVHRTAFGVRLSKPASQAHEVHFIDRTALGVRWKQQSEGNETTLCDTPRSSLRRKLLCSSDKCPRVHRGSATRLPLHLHPNSPYNPQQTAHCKRGAQRHTKQHSHYSHTTSSGNTSSFPQITQMLTDSFETIRHATPSMLTREICVRRRTAKRIEDLYGNGFVEPQTTPCVSANHRAEQRLLRCDNRGSALHPPMERLAMAIEVRYTRTQS